MTIQQLAKQRRLRIVSERLAVKRALVLNGEPKPDTEHIPGARGWITEAGRGRLRVFFTTRYLNAFVAEGKAAGMVTACRGDDEAAMFFDGHDERQARNAIRFIKARRKRQVSEEQRKAAAERLRRFQWAPGKPFPEAEAAVEGARDR